MVIEDVDSTPRPLRIKKIRKSPSMPFGGVRDSRPLPQLARRGPPPSRSFLGLSFPPQPKPRSSSAGVLLTDKMNHISGDGASVETGLRTDTVRRASSQRQAERKELPGAGMAWLQRAKSVRPLSTPTSTNEALDDIQSGVSFSPPSGYQNARRRSWQISKSRDSSGDATAGTSFRSSSYQSLDDEPRTPIPKDGNILGGNGKKSKPNYGGSTFSEKEHSSEDSVGKTPAKGWKEKMFSRDFFTRGSAGTSLKKEAKAKNIERSNSVSSANTTKSAHIQRSSTVAGKPTSTRIDISSNHSWCEPDYQYSRNGTRTWQLDGNGATSSLTGSGIRHKSDFNDSVLGIFEGSVGGVGRTRLKKAGHWKPPTLQLQMEVVAETEKVPITYPGGHGDEKVVWVSIELDGKVDEGTESFEGIKVGLDVAVLMDVSYAFP